jgi:hypothetical protein
VARGSRRARIGLVMTDSVLVFDPGYRVTDANGNPVHNAKIKFREIGPGAAKCPAWSWACGRDR